MATEQWPWEDRHADILRLISLTGESLPHMVFDGTIWDEPLMYTAAYFARCRRLLIGMEALIEQELPDVSGVFVRPLLECWLRGLWLLNGGQEAYATLRTVADVSVTQWNERQSTGDWAAEMQRISTREIGALKLVKELAPLIGGNAISNGPALLESYCMLYGLESERDIHHGLEAVEGHIAATGTGPLAILPERIEPWDIRNQLTWGAHLLIVFARFLYPHFGLSIEPLDSLPSLRPEALLADWRPARG